jgi:hypothetical protein
VGRPDESRRGAKIVTFHRSFPYFAHAFDLDIVEELEPKPGIHRARRTWST